MTKLIIALFLVSLSFASFAASSEEAENFAKKMSGRDCSVILDVLLERTVEANRLGLAAHKRLSANENDKAGNQLLELSTKEFELSEAMKSLLVTKCFK